MFPNTPRWDLIVLTTFHLHLTWKLWSNIFVFVTTYVTACLDHTVKVAACCGSCSLQSNGFDNDDNENENYNGDYNDGDNFDLYIMGAVCLCVCYVFSYFFFFTPPPPLCWENYFGRWIFFLKTFFFFLSNVSFRFFFKNLF